MYDNEFLPRLSQDLLEILENNELFDITIEVGNDSKTFHAHMIILICRSPYLRRLISTNVNVNKNKNERIKLPNILPETFQMILRYIYGGRLSLEEYDTSNIIKLLIASNELNLQELITHLQLFLIKNKKDWMVQNFSLIYNTSFEKDSFLELQNFCKEFMFKEPKKIFDSRDFTSLPENCLITLIQHENFQNNVIQVWEHVLEWGIAKNPELPSDPSNYSKDDFKNLKNTLQQSIPFIKFNNLSHQEFLDKVYPYKKILPKDLRDELIRHFINQSTNRPEPKTIKENSSKNIDSKIITKQHAELISKWIDKLDVKDEIENPYEFELILRGSRDGFSPKRFHEICDNKSHTISIIKVKGSNEILGGYNSIIWKSDDKWGTTKDSFIFSFKNKNSIKNYTLSRVKSEVCAIDNDPAHGPSFGSSDLELYENNRGGAFGPVYYETSIRGTNGEFSVEEYEIFQITKECEPEEESNCNIS
ncbi:unnamed protein product [Rhizophagus irregularis]|nr:unnamed protein product [Rhizophagus irregularis]